jgi:hypothetical protein
MKVLKKYEFPAPVSAVTAKYPWDEFLDGAIREFLPADLDGVDLKTFRSMAKDRANKRHKKVNADIKFKGEGDSKVAVSLVLQAVEMTAEEIAEYDRREAEKKAKAKAKKAEAKESEESDENE